jgi:hypothetical protein
MALMRCSSCNLRASLSAISVSTCSMKMGAICEACLGFGNALMMDGSAGVRADDDDGRAGG